MRKIEINNRQTTLAIDPQRLTDVIDRVLELEGVEHAEISVAIVDDPTMHQLNRQYLDHDYPTDVLSFVLEDAEECLEGEVIVSADTAASVGPTYDNDSIDELMYYLVHGCLHLVGYDDHEDDDRRTMRDREQRYLTQLGLTPKFGIPGTEHHQGSVRGAAS